MPPTKGMRVWLPVEDTDQTVLATVEDFQDDSVFLTRLHAPPHIKNLTVELTNAQFEKLPVAVGNVMSPGEDLVLLEDVSDATILHTLRLRLDQKKIFTSIGPVLVVVNPYQPVESCGEKNLTRLTAELALTTEYIGSASPHAHRTVANAYLGLRENTRGGGAQSILVSGESGAGKTETTKIAMSCLAAISKSSGGLTDAALESSFLLEAIGNARTVYNNNSSRFGKWMAVHFDQGDKIHACKIRSYLLEQSRVVGASPGERTYHIFYYLLKGCSAAEKSKYGLLDSLSKYKYTRGGEFDAPGTDDVQGWIDMKEKLAMLGLTEGEVDGVLQACATVLNMGNVEFRESGAEVFTVSNVDLTSQVASEFKVAKTLLEAKLTTKTVKTGRGSTYTINLNNDQCNDTRDALAKAVYSGMFDWVISKLNVTLGGNEVPESDLRFIGFLDIFGFENFQFNTFEQLCINFTNERLQSHFTDALIKRQQEDYKREGVTCAHINFPDNSLQIQLIDGNKGSVYSMLDEECLVPKGNEEAYVGKMLRMFDKPHKCASLFFKPRIGKNGDKIKGKPVTDKSVAELAKVSFIITHYAGEVLYTADSWLEKNRGALHEDLRALLGASESEMIQKIFATEVERKVTVGYAYRASLRALSDTMAATNQHYIRCLKPNMQKAKMLFHGDVMSRQLAYTGCSAVVQIQRSGYPVAFVLKDFVATYRCIAFREPALINNELPNSEIVKNLLTYGQGLSEEKDQPGWLTPESGLRVQIGKTKVFMRDDVLKHLEGPKNEVHGGAALVVQTSQRRHAVLKSMGAVNFHKEAIKAIKEALSKGDGKVASEKLEELQVRWQGMTLDENMTMVQTMKEQLAEITQDVADLKDRVKIAWESGDRYEGAWRNENMNGKGTYYYADGNIYEGQWVEGNKHGEGTHTWVDGQVYKGQWVDDTMHGRGKYTFPNGNTYEGQYVGGVRDGKGKFTYANGGVYTGGFSQGKKNGFGTYVDPNGKLVYEGNWEDKEHGFGKFVFPNGAVYEGEFVKGKKEGKAKYSDPSGAIYEGSFVAGKREGYGKYTDPSGAVAYQGEWKDGQPANL
eukprot:CAMPEP_0119057708 /NCGR_PEP_ID=MMETSP1178-20130426/2102_1 /TAXON_ID=33656 /ORGANISM="unid sp, Strain CCMP2000" /LENGTH=1078 /DNA_ID=CAMNT_0007038565 /DNA_START=76 /DNA_END=3312 /DNA_ORIENTATION=-